MARKSRKQTAAPMPAPSLYVHVALYIRLSVEDNKKRGCSVENQKLVLNDFLSDKPDFVVYDTYIDNGATGTNFHRPGFQQMLSDIEAGHINCVIVKDLSRLGRNSIDTGYYIEQYFHAHEHAINALSGEIEVFEKSMDSLDNQLARYRAMEKDAKTLAQDHVLTAELIERLIERIEIDHERNIHVTFRFKNEFQGKAVEPCATM